MPNGWLSEGVFNKIKKSVPIFCVDMFILYEKEGFLWIRRNVEPEKDEWAPIGGRVLRDETIEQACKRIAKREVGLNIRVLCQLGIDEQLSYKDRHTISVFHIAEPVGDELIKLNFKEATLWHKSWFPPEPISAHYKKMYNRIWTG